MLKLLQNNDAAKQLAQIYCVAVRKVLIVVDNIFALQYDLYVQKTANFPLTDEFIRFCNWLGLHLVKVKVKVKVK